MSAGSALCEHRPKEDVVRWLQGRPCVVTVWLGSELVHLGGRRGDASRARPEVRVHGSGAADRDDAAQAVAVVSDAVSHAEHLIWWDRISGCVEGTCGETPPGRWGGHNLIILLLRASVDSDVPNCSCGFPRSFGGRRSPSTAKALTSELSSRGEFPQARRHRPARCY